MRINNKGEVNLRFKYKNDDSISIKGSHMPKFKIVEENFHFSIEHYRRISENALLGGKQQNSTDSEQH